MAYSYRLIYLKKKETQFCVFLLLLAEKMII